MKIINKHILLICSLCLLVSCNQSKDKKLGNYINNDKNGLKKIHEINGVTYEVSYRPSQFFIQKEKDRNQQINIDSLKKTYDSNYYFVLNLSAGEVDLMRAMAYDRQEFGKMVHELAFRLEEKTTLITNKKDTIPVAMSHFVRTYGMSPKNSILLSFSKEELTQPIDWLKINVKDIGLNSGDMSFKFQEKDIAKVSK